MTIASIEEAQQRTEDFLTVQMPRALRAVDHAWPPFGAAAMTIDEAAQARVEVRHVRGAADAMYLVAAFEDELLMQLQLNVWRLVAVYRTPQVEPVDAAALATRLERWQLGAQHAGWVVGWREAGSAAKPAQRFIETYCYAAAAPDFLDNPLQQLYWRTDIVQMTRHFILEARRCGVTLSPRRLGAEL